MPNLNDSVEFLKVYGEMCNKYNLCERCPVSKSGLSCSIDDLSENAETVYEIVDRWVRENK